MSGDVRVTGLTHRYGEQCVLDSVDLMIPKAALLAVVGPTGCGKSTILRVLAGLLTPSSGSAAVGRRSMIGSQDHAAYMPQGDTLLPWRTALENATLGTQVAGDRTDTANRRARAVFSRFGLQGFEDAWPNQLSGGMRQRVALLRTVLLNRPVMLLDEPFGALDQITRTDLQGWFAELIADGHHTTLLITHDIDEALRLADEIVVLSPRPGRVVDRITVGESRPRHPARLTEPDFAMMKRRVLAALHTR